MSGPPDPGPSSPNLRSTDSPGQSPGRRHRRLKRLATATAVAAVGLAAGGTAGPLLAADMVGEQLAGVPIAVLTAGSAAAAPLIAGIGTRHGRLLGLRAGQLLGAVGAAGGVLAAALDSCPILLVTSLLLGAGNTSIFLSRYTASDLAVAGRVARSMGLVLSATAVGAIASPLLLGPAGRLVTGLGLPSFAGLYLVAAATYTLGAVLLPHRTAQAGPQQPVNSRTILCGLDIKPALAGLEVLSTTNLPMVGVMSIAPVHLVAHDMEAGTVGLVVVAHVAAIVGPSCPDSPLTASERRQPPRPASRYSSWPAPPA